VSLIGLMTTYVLTCSVRYDFHEPDGNISFIQVEYDNGVTKLFVLKPQLSMLNQILHQVFAIQNRPFFKFYM